MRPFEKGMAIYYLVTILQLWCLKVRLLNIEMKILDIQERWAQFSEECRELHQNLVANFYFYRVPQTGGRERCSTKKSEMNCS